MRARIYQPARNAMTSGQAKTKSWVLECTAEEARRIDPLMGWTSADDTNAQVRISFDSKDAALEFARAKGIAVTVTSPNKRRANIRPGGYADNFATDRRTVWTH